MNKLTRFLTSSIDISQESACVSYLSDVIYEIFGLRPRADSITQYSTRQENFVDSKGRELAGLAYQPQDDSLGCTVTRLDLNGEPIRNDIVIKSMLTREGQYIVGVLLHELFHTIDKGTLNKPIKLREGMAEIAAELVCRHLGFEHHPAYGGLPQKEVRKNWLPASGLDFVEFAKLYYSNSSLSWFRELVEKRFSDVQNIGIIILHKDYDRLFDVLRYKGKI